MENENNTDLVHVTSLSATNDSTRLEQNYAMILKNISHEFGNILTLINSSLQIIESSHPEVRSYKYWNSTMSDVHYMKDLVNELICFNNSAKLNLKTFDVNILISNIIESFSLEASYKNISFITHLSEKKTIIIADFVKIKQALINLVKNACEAIDGKGKITISLQKQEHTVTIAVNDTGCGIAEEIIQDIFIPMFTNKKNGCGLGLAITKNIITSHNGTLEVATQLGVGTTFTITLPIAQNEILDPAF